MKEGFLSEYFEGVIVKRLSAVEAHPERSNQHEFNGTTAMKELLGVERVKLSTQFVFVGDEEDEMAAADGFVTWYDAREGHPTRSEHHLYYPTTAVSERASEGDLLVIGKRPDGSALVAIAKARSTAENQLLWLLGLPDDLGEGFTVREMENGHDTHLGYGAKFILESLGIEIQETADDFLEQILKKFSGSFPVTKVFSAFARDTLEGVSPLDDPDAALLAWVEREEVLFRTLERHIVQDKIRQGFTEVDDFISYSLSVHNRRKSRAGYAMENHLEQIFQEYGLSYSREKITENRSKPDFLFPGISEYHDDNFPKNKLTMLGAKTTCKDRWRQVLAEAKRIDEKHLFTLEPGISENQTQEMQEKMLQLVLPKEIHASYNESQQQWLLGLSDFIELVRERQT